MPDAMLAPSRVTPAEPPRVWFTLGQLEITTSRLIWILVVAGTLIALALGWHQIDVEAAHTYAEQLPWWAVVGTMTAVPLLGVPVAILHVVAGMRFGIPMGLLVVAVTTLIHHLVGYSLVRLSPKAFARRLQGWRARFPRGAHRAMTVFSCLVPGMPYAVQLYLLPVLGVPLRILLTVSVPLHTLRAVISIVGGDLSDQLTPGRIALFILYYAVLTVLCMLALRRIRSALR